MKQATLSPEFIVACTRMRNAALHSYVCGKPPRLIRKIADEYKLIGDERRRFGVFAGSTLRRARSISMRCFPDRMIVLAGMIGIFFGFPVGGIVGFTFLSPYIGLLGLFVGIALGFIVVCGVLATLSIAQSYMMFRKKFLRETTSVMDHFAQNANAT
ncbi:MAG: hypothetical protein Q7S16_04110 [bacterium]|nr:hypothetical protein [bacterium]